MTRTCPLTASRGAVSDMSARVCGCVGGWVLQVPLSPLLVELPHHGPGHGGGAGRLHQEGRHAHRHLQLRCVHAARDGLETPRRTDLNWEVETASRPTGV